MMDNNIKSSIAAAIQADFNAMLEGMKRAKAISNKVGIIEGVEDMTPGQLYDETYRQILSGTIKELQLKLEGHK